MNQPVDESEYYGEEGESESDEDAVSQNVFTRGAAGPTEEGKPVFAIKRNSNKTGAGIINH